MNHSEIAEICRKVLVNEGHFRSEQDIPAIPWDSLVYDFAQKHKGVDYNEEIIADRFRKEVIND